MVGEGEGGWEQDLPKSTKFGWLKQPKLVGEMVEMGWEEREGRDKSGEGKVRGWVGLAALIDVLQIISGVPTCLYATDIWNISGVPVMGTPPIC